MPTGGADGASTLKKRVRRRYSPFSTYTYFPFIRFLFFFRRYSRRQKYRNAERTLWEKVIFSAL
jgi:hypothetical protein